MRVKTIPSEWISRDGRRLDCGPYMSGALEAKIRLERMSCRKERLADLCEGGADGIYHAGRESRTWVDEPEFGVPFLSSSSILAADLSGLPLISKKQVAANPRFTLRPGWTLITRSGTIGRMVYTRPDMAGLACSEHVMRVVPNLKKVRPGYLFAFLSSKFGVPLVTSGTYGSIIQSIEPQHIADLPVPRLGDKVERRAHALVEEAASLRTDASSALCGVTGDVEREIGAPSLRRLSEASRAIGNAVSIRAIGESRRFEAFFYNPVAIDLDRWVADHPNGHWLLGEVSNVFDVPPFKHVYVDEERGVPFYTSGDLFRLERLPEKYLSRTRTRDLVKYILEGGWVLLARSGQLGGIIGRPQFADSALHEAAASDHVIRIVPDRSRVPPGYLYAYLSTPTVGYMLLTRTMTGASVPALWPKYLNDVCVVKADVDFMADIDKRVQRSFENRVTATQREREARALVERAIEEAA